MKREQMSLTNGDKHECSFADNGITKLWGEHIVKLLGDHIKNLTFTIHHSPKNSL